MKLVLVTGGAGHVGSHVIEEQLLDNSKIISLDNYFNGSVENHIVSDLVEYRRGNTADIASLVPETPDIIYHLGEYARVAQSFDEPDKVFAMNTTGTVAVVEFCRQRKVQKLVYAASSTKFGDDGNGGEGKNQSPYAFSKYQNVQLITNYGKWYGLPYVICYFFNAFGPREKGGGKYGTVIANFEQAYLHNRPLEVVKPGTQRRNFTYVKDLARGLILAGGKGNGDGYALNNPNSYSILEIARAYGRQIKMIEGRPGRSGTDDLPTKAQTELGWKTTVDVLDYIAQFVHNNSA
jgi:UDP-glucose 4-epimerase